jgi:hypothetical protein
MMVVEFCIYIYLVLNEINQYAHRFDEKPPSFKLAEICQQVCVFGIDIIRLTLAKVLIVFE